MRKSDARRRFENLEPRRMLAVAADWRPIDSSSDQILTQSLRITAAEAGQQAEPVELELSEGDWFGWRASLRDQDSADAVVPAFTLTSPDGSPIGEIVSANGRAAMASVEILESGVYQLAYQFTAGNTYKVDLFINAAVEVESFGGSSNNSPESAVDISYLFESELPVATVLGRLPYNEEIVQSYNFPDSLDDWQITVAGSGRTSLDDSVAPPAMRFDSPFGAGTVEAVLPLDLDGIGAPVLRFAHKYLRRDNDISERVPFRHADRASGNGISITSDGDNWHRLQEIRDNDVNDRLNAYGLEASDVSALKVQFELGNGSTTQAMQLGGLSVADLSDWYRFDATAGEWLTFESFAGESPAEINVYDANLRLLASDASTLVVPEPFPGEHETQPLFVRVTRDRHEYELRIQKSSTPPESQPFVVNSHELMRNSNRSAFVLALSQPIAAQTVFPDSILINGEPAKSVAVDGDRIRFDADLPDTIERPHRVDVNAGSFFSTHGDPIDAFSGSILVDRRAPELNRVSISPGDTLSPGLREVTLRFNEPVSRSIAFETFTCREGARRCDRGRVRIQEPTASPIVELTIPEEGDYRLWIGSAYDRFGNETKINQEIPFTVDVQSEPLRPRPLGVWGSRDTLRSLISADDVDEYTFFAEAGSYVNFWPYAIESPTRGMPVFANQLPWIELISPEGDLLQREIASEGKRLESPIQATGNYTLRIASRSNAPIKLRGQFAINDLQEFETTIGENDSPETAQSLDGAWRDYNGRRYVSVEARYDVPIGDDDDWYRFTLDQAAKIEIQISLLLRSSDRGKRPTFELFDASTNESLSVSEPNRNLTQQSSETLSAGEYLIRVSHATQSYLLELIDGGRFIAAGEPTIVQGDVVLGGQFEKPWSEATIYSVGELAFGPLGVAHGVRGEFSESSYGIHVAANDRHIIVGGSSDSPLSIFDQEERLVLRLPNVYGPIHGLALDSTQLYVASGNQIMIADYPSGEIESTLTLDDAFQINDLATDNGRLFLSSGSSIYEVDKANGDLTSVATACCESITGIEFSNGNLIVATPAKIGAIDDVTGIVDAQIEFSDINSLAIRPAATLRPVVVDLVGVEPGRIHVAVELSNEIDDATLQLLNTNGEIIAEETNRSGDVELFVGSVESRGNYQLRLWSASESAGHFLIDIRSSGLPYDLNGDGQVSAADIDLIALAIRQQSADFKYDLNEDGQVDENDRMTLIDRMFIPIGDTNFDLVFDSQDLVSVMQYNVYDQDVDATWATGDWNGDGRFDSADLVLAMTGGD